MEDEIKIAYVVSSGEYSAYYIEAVFSTNKKAQMWIDEQEYPDNFSIEEYAIDQIETVNKLNRKPYYVKMNIKDGTVVEVKVEPDELVSALHNEVYNYMGDFSGFYMLAKDEEHAIKIASERRGKLIANGEW